MGCLSSFRSFSLSAVELSGFAGCDTANLLVHSSLPSPLHKHLRIYITTIPFVFPMLYHLKMPSSCLYTCSFVHSFIHYESHTHPPPSYLPSSRMRIIIVIILCLVVLLALAARSFPIKPPSSFFQQKIRQQPRLKPFPIPSNPEAAICPISSTQFSTPPDGTFLNRAGCGHSPRSWKTDHRLIETVDCRLCVADVVPLVPISHPVPFEEYLTGLPFFLYSGGP